jgi:purine-nucleoside phosphorylase
MTTKSLSEFLKPLGISSPDIHIVLGSGLASAWEQNPIPDSWKELVDIHFKDVAGLVPSTAPGHSGKYKILKNLKTGKTICIQCGRLHGYEGLSPKEVVQTVMQTRLLGTKKYLLTNASGSLNASYKPGDLMLIKDQINLTGTNPLYGPNPKKPDGVVWGPRFPDMSEVFSTKMNQRLKDFLVPNFSVQEGVYLGLPGPAYETPAEVRLFASWGLDAVGMSTVWESTALRHSGAEISGISFISNYGCGLTNAKLNHEDIEKEAHKIAKKLTTGLLNWAEKELSYE